MPWAKSPGELFPVRFESKTADDLDSHGAVRAGQHVMLGDN
jgi:hypothetical protein